MAQASMQEAMELLDISSRLRKLNMSVTFMINGWKAPDGAAAALGMTTASPAEIIAELATLRVRLQELAHLDPPASGWVAEPGALAAETLRLSALITDLMIERPAEAAETYRAAGAAFAGQGMQAEAESATRNAATLGDTASAGVESHVATARAALERAQPGTNESALLHIDLGEALLHAGHTFEARQVLVQAQADLAAAGHPQPPDGMAALLGAMSGMFGKDGLAAIQKTGDALKLRLAFHRLYDGLAKAFDPVDAAEAARYRGLIQTHRLLTPDPFA